MWDINRGNIKWEVGHPKKDGVKSSKDKYDNEIEDRNGTKNWYDNDMGEGKEQKMDMI